MRSTSTSYSSRISPTISSSRSSTVTRPAVPPYSSTTMATLDALALELLQQLGHALGLGHEMRRPDQRRDRLVGRRSALQQDQVLHEHEAQHVVEGLFVDRHARVLLLAEQRLAAARTSRSASMPMMSGRGVMTSRTMVSRKSTSDAEQLARLPFLHRLGLRGHGRRRSSRRRRLVGSVAAVGGALLAAAGADPQQRRCQRAQQAWPATSNDGSSTSRTRSGSCRTISSGSRCSQTSTMPMTDSTSTGKPARIDARDARHQGRADDGDDGAQDACGNEQPARVVEVPAERVVAVGALGVDAQRQPHQRS